MNGDNSRETNAWLLAALEECAAPFDSLSDHGPTFFAQLGHEFFRRQGLAHKAIAIARATEAAHKKTVSGVA